MRTSAVARIGMNSCSILMSIISVVNAACVGVELLPVAFEVLVVRSSTGACADALTVWTLFCRARSTWVKCSPLKGTRYL